MSKSTVRLLGVETEHAATALAGDGAPVASELANGMLLEQARRRPHLRARHASGLFFSNGSLLYIDGAHPELATAEASTPDEAVAQIKAGELLLDELAQEVCEETYLEQFLISRTNVHYSPPATWGCHESISHRVSDNRRLAEMLIPLLATRMIYAGAGGFDAQRSVGIRFLLSPRVRFLENARSPHSTQQRGIFHDKSESFASGGHRRLHVLAECSLYSERAIWLKLGVLACVTALVETGSPPPDGVRLVHPVAAMRTYAADSTLAATAMVAGGDQKTALEIQQAYLSLVEQYAEHPVMPPWVDKVCALWRASLAELAEGDPAIEGRYDWAIKRKCFAAFAQRRGFDFDMLDRWNDICVTLAGWGQGQAGGSIDACAAGWQTACRRTAAASRKRAVLNALAEEKELDYNAIPGLLALRQELFELDWRFGQLGDRGLFAQLDAAGQLEHQLCSKEQIDHARQRPPAKGRARLRGEWVARLQNEPNARCSWSAIYAQRGVLDLRDPLSERATWIARDDAVRSDECFEFPPPQGDSRHAAGRGRDTRPRSGSPPNSMLAARFDRACVVGRRQAARGRYRDAHDALGRLAGVHRLDRRRRYDLSRLQFRLRARLGEIDDQELRIINQYHTGRRPPTLRDIVEVLYANRFGRSTPAVSELSEWLDAGRRLAASGGRLARWAPRLVAEFHEMLAYYCLIAGQIEEAAVLCTRLTAADVGALLSPRRSCWAMVTEAAIERSRGEYLLAERSLRRARQLQRRHGYVGDEAEMTVPLTARLLVETSPAGTALRRGVDSALHDALHAVDFEQNPLGKLRILEAYAELVGDEAADRRCRELEQRLTARRQRWLF